jgi:hypothetical protein
VTLKDADDQEHKVRCEISADQHDCTGDLTVPDIQQVLTGDRP